ncbi:hypothetical protein AYO29_04605 [Coxiella burnetii str. Schperling]|nr:hypothetical protein AYO29_04605 [Coxiella burnetii str. Schperling]PHH58080.1 hypothetical protein CRH12_01020 [Coxiella burnetii]
MEDVKKKGNAQRHSLNELICGLIFSFCRHLSFYLPCCTPKKEVKTKNCAVHNLKYIPFL